MATLRAFPEATSLSTISLNMRSCSATAALRVVIAPAQFAEDPTARNSKRLPVKAKGEVRLRSVLSTKISGISTRPRLLPFFPAISMGVSEGTSSSLWSTSVIVRPRKAETIAGGASLAPRRWALVAVAMDAFRRALCFWTAARTLTKNVMNCRFPFESLPGAISRTPVSVPRDQLLCFPEPLTPSKGFSCRSTTKPCLRASLFIRFITIWFWSLERFVSPKMGASSNWLGATSL